MSWLRLPSEDDERRKEEKFSCSDYQPLYRNQLLQNEDPSALPTNVH